MNELLNTLYVQTPGTSLRLENDTVRIYHPDQPGRKILPLARIDHIVLFRGVTISDELQLRCVGDRRSISWLSGFGRFHARMSGPTAGNPLLRLAQYRSHDDPLRRLDIAQRMVAGKLHNSRQVLLRSGRDATGQRQTKLRAAAERHADLLTGTPKTRNVDTLLGTEGAAAGAYFDALPAMCAFAPTPFRRTRRPPTDPVNCLLSFAYGMLRVSVHGGLEQVGLDPYIGFLHGVRPGKPALALDLMEEFRPLLADRFVTTMLNRKELTDDDFTHLPGNVVELNDNSRRTVLNAWQTNRQRLWPHAYLKREIPAALLPLVQARLLARHLRGDLDEYTPWTVT